MMNMEKNDALDDKKLQDQQKGSESVQIVVNKHYNQQQWKYMFSMLVIGLMNNAGFCLVNSSSQKLAKRFHKEDLMASFQSITLLSQTVARLVAIKLLIRVSHQTRINWIVILIIVLTNGILTASNLIDSIYGFYLALLASGLIGIGCSIGEFTILGYLQNFPSEMVGGWSSGTGFSGVFSYFFYLVYQVITSDHDQYLFIFLMPSISVPYYCCFKWLESRRKSFTINLDSSLQNDDQQNHNINNNMNNNINFNNDYHKIENEGTTTIEDNNESSKQNIELNWTNFKQLYPLIWLYSFNMAFVYYLEYTIQLSFFDRANPVNNISTNFFIKHAYVVLGLSYQIGVLFSRSSLSIVKIQKIYLMTIFQAVFFMIYFMECFYHFLTIYGQVGLSFCVGLMGGASYVNIAYSVLNDHRIPKNAKELSLSICGISNDVGTLSAGITALIFSNTILKTK